VVTGVQCTICLVFDVAEEMYEMCPNSHYYHDTCLDDYYKNCVIDSKPVTLKCIAVGCGLNFNTSIEAVLDEEIYVKLLKRDLIDYFEIPSGFGIYECPLCPPKHRSMCIYDKSDFHQFYPCQNDECMKKSCMYCYCESINESDHLKCEQANKNILMDLIAAGNYGYASICNVCFSSSKHEFCKGQFKGGECSHINCIKCSKPTCFICLTKAESLGPEHNDDEGWKTDMNKCPLFLNCFDEIVEDWPADDKEGHIKVFTRRILLALKAVIDKHGSDNVKNVLNVFMTKRLDMYTLENINESVNLPGIEVIDSRLMKNFNI